jgi:multiple sugar transport system ATP-binding protein
MANLKLREISKSFASTPILREVSLDVRDGEFLTLLGPSGCGKSTLLRIIAGLEQPCTGSISIGDRVVDRWRAKDRDIAMVFQSYALYPHMTVAANLALPLLMRRLTPWQRLPLIGSLLPRTRAVRAAIAQEIGELATSLDLGHLLDRKPAQLSGGQRQRVALARAMVRRPAVFLMDEPLSNLDSTLRTQLRAEIAALRRKLSAAFIYVTHDQTEAMTLSDRVAVMFGGRIVQIGSPQSLYTQPATRQVAEFIGTPRINMLEGAVRPDLDIDVSDTHVVAEHDLAPGSRVFLGIRPEHLRLTERMGPATFTARIQRLEYMGNDILLYAIVLGQREPLVMRLSPQESTGLKADVTVHITAARAPVLLFDDEGRAVSSRSGVVRLVGQRRS